MSTDHDVVAEVLGDSPRYEPAYHGFVRALLAFGVSRQTAYQCVLEAVAASARRHYADDPDAEEAYIAWHRRRIDGWLDTPLIGEN